MTEPAGSLCGVWMAEDGRVFTTVARPDGSREERIESLRPFAWLNAMPAEPPVAGGAGGLQIERLGGESPFGWLLHADDRGVFDNFVRQAREGVSVDVTRPLENQFLLQHRQRLYRDL